MFKNIVCTLAFSIFSTNLCYGATVISASGINDNINLKNTSIISVKNGESVYLLKNLPSVFGLTFTNNEYITSKFASVVSEDKSAFDVPVYSSPKQNAQKVGDIYVGAMVVVSKEIDEYSEIFFNEEIAYIPTKNLVSSGFLSPAKEEDEELLKYGKVVYKDGANIKKMPNLSSETLDTLQRGEYLDLIAYDGDFIKVKYEGTTGYVLKEKIKMTNEKNDTQQENNKKSTADDIINFAKNFLGKPYVYGGTDLSKGTDCSGFTFSVFKNFDINLNRISRDQYLNGENVEKENLKKGDLVFFNTGGASQISHVGIYIENGDYIHSTDSKGIGVTISSLNSDYAQKTYYGARRVLNNF